MLEWNIVKSSRPLFSWKYLADVTPHTTPVCHGMICDTKSSWYQNKVHISGLNHHLWQTMPTEEHIDYNKEDNEDDADDDANHHHGRVMFGLRQCCLWLYCLYPTQRWNRYDIIACSWVISALGVGGKDTDAVFCISCETLHLKNSSLWNEAIFIHYPTSRLVADKERLPSRTSTPSSSGSSTPSDVSTNL